MKIITFVTQKGGSGKTALTTNCAVAAEQHGRRAIIVDLDPQGTAEAWYQTREADTPKLIKIGVGDLPPALEAAKKGGFDFVFIDTPGDDEPATAAAIRSADFCIIPCRPTSADMKATPRTVATINRLNKSAAFVLMQTFGRGKRIKEAQKGLSVLGIVCPINVVSRMDFQDAHTDGLAVTEYDPESKAAQNLRDLWAWVETKLEKTVYDK